MKCRGPNAACQMDATYKVTFGRDRIVREICTRHAWAFIRTKIDQHDKVEVERLA